MKFDKLCFERKFDLAIKALEYIKEIEEDEIEIAFKEIHLSICQDNFPEALNKI